VWQLQLVFSAVWFVALLKVIKSQGIECLSSSGVGRQHYVDRYLIALLWVLVRYYTYLTCNIKAISLLVCVCRDANVIARFHKELVWWHHSTVTVMVLARDMLCGRLMHRLVDRTLNVSITPPTQTWISPSATVMYFYKKENENRQTISSPGLSMNYHTI